MLSIILFSAAYIDLACVRQLPCAIIYNFFIVLYVQRNYIVLFLSRLGFFIYGRGTTPWGHAHDSGSVPARGSSALASSPPPRQDTGRTRTASVIHPCRRVNPHSEHRFPAPSSKLCMHVNMRHPVKKEKEKKEFHLDYSNADCGLICAGVNLCWWLYMTRLVLFDLFVTNLLLFEHQQKNCSLAFFWTLWRN